MNTATMQWHSPIGLLTVEVSDAGVRSISFTNNKCEQHSSHHLALKTIQQLKEYFAGTRTTFDVPLDAQGTAFQRAVWDATARIPAGEVRSYAEVAHAIGRPRAVRAVGQALNRNPLLLIVPCHRVRASSGALGGFALGVHIKAQLLTREGVAVPTA